MRRKKIKAEEVLLICIYMLISVCGFFFGIYAQQRAELASVSTLFYSENAKALAIALNMPAAEIPVNLFIDYADEKGDLSVYNGTLTNTVLVNGFYSTIKNVQIPVTQGVGFRYENFNIGEKTAVAVIKKKIFQSVPDKTFLFQGTVKKGDDYYFEDYKIIGWYSVDSANLPSSKLVVSMDSQFKYRSSFFIIESTSVSRTRECFEELCDLLNESGYSYEAIDLPPNSLDIPRFFGVSILDMAVILFTVLTVVVATIPSTTIWVEKRFNEIAIKRLFGVSVTAILLSVYFRFFVMYNAGFFIVFAGGKILELLDVGLTMPKLFSNEILYAYLAAFAVNTVTALIPMHKCVKIEPGDALRKV